MTSSVKNEVDYYSAMYRAADMLFNEMLDKLQRGDQNPEVNYRFPAKLLARRYKKNEQDAVELLKATLDELFIKELGLYDDSE